MGLHADLLANGRSESAAKLARRVADRDLAGLMDVARRARIALPAVRPASAFRERLREELIASSQPLVQAGATKKAWLRRHAVATAAVAGGAAAAAAGTALVFYVRLLHTRRAQEGAAQVPGA